MTPAVTSECAHIAWRAQVLAAGDVFALMGRITSNIWLFTSNRFHRDNVMLFLLLNECVSSPTSNPVRSCQRVWTRLHRVTVIPPSLAALAFGSDQDYQLDIISELDLANATYGITQVAGLHNNSKAFLFRGNARTHARWRFLPQKFWTIFASRVHTRVRKRLFVSLVGVIKGLHATPLWRDGGRSPRGASS